MEPHQSIIYIKANKHSVVQKPEVTIGMIASVSCVNRQLQHQIASIPLHHFEAKPGQNQMEFFTMLKVISLIQDAFPETVIKSIGEQDFLVEYTVRTAPPAWVNHAKVFLLCIVIFFGSAFTIMAFNNDISITDIFERFYLQVMGQEKGAVSELEISYSLGLAAGILLFFNHLGKRRFSGDPTPIQIEVHKFADDMDDTLIEHADRKGQTQDAS